MVNLVAVWRHRSSAAHPELVCQPSQPRVQSHSRIRGATENRSACGGKRCGSACARRPAAPPAAGRLVGARRRSSSASAASMVSPSTPLLAQLLAQRLCALGPELLPVLDPIAGKLGVVQVALLGQPGQHRFDDRRHRRPFRPGGAAPPPGCAAGSPESAPPDHRPSARASQCLQAARSSASSRNWPTRSRAASNAGRAKANSPSRSTLTRSAVCF